MIALNCTLVNFFNNCIYACQTLQSVVQGLNLKDTIYPFSIHSQILCDNCYCVEDETKMNKKRPGLTHTFKNIVS